ncbi:uncharacterized protein LOC123877046 [Maniola jurtina]|uniref:uncharacterized protein LOC123877046 n=1 Tax=Maniola jurtina TaxID=191418 RepID=UPI001E689A78|nr:uncharacterized protein LOC123877046 [Maniola jurtina]
MKFLVAICLIVLVGLSLAKDLFHPRGCIWKEGLCIRDCEEGTHEEYKILCYYFTPEPTCDNPNPVPDTELKCDRSACYCDAPTVRDTATNKCVRLEDCPKK